MLDVVLEFIAPLKCAGCDAPGAVLCEACWNLVERIDPAVACPRCGEPLDARRPHACPCRSAAFEAVRSFGRLEPPLSSAVALHKDPGERRYGPVLGLLAATACADWAGWPDAVVAVPPKRSACLRRGYDHTRPLARVVAARLGAREAPLLVARERPDQRALGRSQRHENVRGAFSVRAEARVPAKIVLVDDVMTTGATLDAAARALLEAGAKQVRAACVARA
ncbi:MAG: ComF family protein [Anaerosomatales bacterium]|nr:ComF family protein [Anaerosomatales bacterium]